MMRFSTRTTIIAFAILLGTISFSACNGAVGSSDPKPTATFGPAVQTRLAEARRPSPTRTPTPDSAAHIPTEPQSTATPRPATSTPQLPVEPTPNPTEEVLLMALLTLQEMPEGWGGGETIFYDPSFLDWFGDGGIFVEPDGEDHCSWGIGAFLSGSIAYFDHDDDYTRIRQNVMLYATDLEADLTLAAMIAAMQICPDSEEMYDGEIVRTTIQTLDYAPLGDRSGAFHMTSSFGDENFDGVIAAFRFGRTITIITQDAMTWHAGPVEEWVTEGVMIRAFEKLDALRDAIESLDRPASNFV
jgi:hypothetical protein